MRLGRLHRRLHFYRDVDFCWGRLVVMCIVMVIIQAMPVFGFVTGVGNAP